ncbi:MAG: riboflavin biosynthesis protein RibF [Candidatus Omnitrophica bacterium]|nr:riboflavin biosynthesis protein RibF [Candidatus Omnitrophota bacterium]
MTVLTRLPSRPLAWSKVVAAIGIFDGVHKGHQAILRLAARRAREIRGTATAVTFYPHPATVLAPHRVPPPLLPLEHRIRLLWDCGISKVLVIPFTRSFSRWPAEKFVEELLVGRLKVREVVVGHDFGFGRGRSGNVGTLRRIGRKTGFKVHVVAPVRVGRQRISSQRIRELIMAGRLEKAASWLGRPAGVTGRVVRGRGRGTGLGFPTANLQVESGVLPPAGVYAVSGELSGGVTFPGMANLGYRPTFKEKRNAGGREDRMLEAHFFGLRRRLYGQHLTLYFFKRLRPERRFSSPAALQKQLLKDAVRAKAALQ